MAQVISTIRSAPGADGPFYVVSEKDGTVTNVTTGVTTLALSLDQAKTDQAAALSGLQWQSTRIFTVGTP